MLAFFQNYWPSFLLTLVLVGGLLYLYKRGHTETVKKIILSLVIQAEKTLGSKTGELKYAMVIERFYSTLPFIIKVLFTKKEIDNFIEEAVQFLKDYLNEERNLMGHDDENIKVLLDNLNL